MKSPARPPKKGASAEKGLRGPLFFERFSPLAEDVFLSAVTRLAAGRGLSIYLVGGMIRNILLNEALPRDYDFLVEGETAELAAEAARELGGSAFLLDKENGLYRVAIKKAGIIITMDFLPLRFPRVEDDLLQRDFTLNAMALPLAPLCADPPAVTLIDPLGGLIDCDKRALRLAGEEALRADPLRSLRAVRLSYRYGLTIDEKTRELIKKQAPLIEEKSVSIERIRDEIALIFTAHRTAEAIACLVELDLLDVAMPPLKSLRGAADLLCKSPVSLKTLKEADTLHGEIEAGSFCACPAEMRSYFMDHQTWPSAALSLKLAAFFHDLCLDPEKTGDLPGSSSHSGASSSTALLSSLLKEMLIGVKTIRAVTGLLRALQRFIGIPAALCARPLVMALFLDKLIDEAGPVIPVFFPLAAAEARSVAEPSNDERSCGISALTEYYFNTYITAPPPPFITGDEIIQSFNIAEGERVGALKEMIEEALFTGLIRDKKEALEYIKKGLF